jgi:phosphatidylserine/phosphatidylglycerophosphate/cardiolipin synthase-like enzyme
MPDHSSPTPAALLKTATCLAENVPSEAFDAVRATLVYLARTDPPVTDESLREHAPCQLSPREAENVVIQLRSDGLVDGTTVREAALTRAFEAAALLVAQPRPPTNRLVATLPRADPALADLQMHSLLSETIELIQRAEDELVLMSPFLAEEAYDQLRPALRTAAGNGATLTLITRYLTYAEDKEWNREFVECVRNDSDLASSLRTYEYTDDETWTTFHAKIVIADGEQAYLGTANLTHRGLTDNLELGVLFRDDTAGRLADLITAMRQSSFLHEVVGSDDIFRRC